MARAAAGLISLALLTVPAAAGDPVFGTWTLDVVRSKGTVFTCYVTSLEDLGNGKFRETTSGLANDGSKVSQEAVMAFDGGDHPNGFGAELTTSFTRIDEQRYMLVYKNRHKVYSMVMRTISADGRTMIDTGDGTRGGKPFHTELVFTRRKTSCEPKPKE